MTRLVAGARRDLQGPQLRLAPRVVREGEAGWT